MTSALAMLLAPVKPGVEEGTEAGVDVVSRS
jgi:hypothetical protein